MAMDIGPDGEPYLYPRGVTGTMRPTGPTMTPDEVRRLLALTLDELSIAVEDGFDVNGFVKLEGRGKAIAALRADFTRKLARVNELAKAWAAFEAFEAESGAR